MRIEIFVYKLIICGYCPSLKNSGGYLEPFLDDKLKLTKVLF